ncbi:cupin domain-containing protein [Pseudomonas sp. TMB3-21]
MNNLTGNSLIQLFFEDDGQTPNSRLPVLIYKNLGLDSADKASAFEALFSANHWPAQWRAQVFDYHHYHSNSHEVLGIAKGRARLKLGGPNGAEHEVQDGDVLILPAGTGHCSLQQSADFLVVGAYPEGQEDYDIQRPDPDTHDASIVRISKVACPVTDPVYGGTGPLVDTWLAG